MQAFYLGARIKERIYKKSTAVSPARHTICRADFSSVATGNPEDANTWLNFVLDTASSPDSDNLFPSWGYFVIFDITPLCSSSPDLLAAPLQVGSCAPPSR